MINPKFRDGRRRASAATTSSSPTRCGTSRSTRTSSPTTPSTASRTAGGVTTGKGDWAWLQHTLACLNDRGRAAVVLDTGAVTRGSGSKNEDKERNIRKWFVDHDLIEGVILLPDNLFYNTTAAGVIVVLSQAQARSAQGQDRASQRQPPLAQRAAEELHPRGGHRPLAAAYLAGEPVEGEVAVITRKAAEEADYNLSPSRWVGPDGVGEGADLKDILDRFDTIIAVEAEVSRDLRPALSKLRELV